MLKIAYAAPGQRYRTAGRIPSIAALWFALMLAGCATGPQIYSTSQHHAVTLQPGTLQQGGVTFITPSSVTGQEEDKQALALTVANVMRERMPGTRCVSLAETLGLINAAGLADEYKRMYDYYRDTGIFRRETLHRVGEITAARYVVQLKLAKFDQGYKSRFGVLGFRVVDTNTTHIRLFFQVWDSKDGSIAWEADEEVSYAFETVKENGTTFRPVVEAVANNIISSLP